MFYKEKFPLPRCYGCALLCYTASNVCACANVVITRWRVRGVLSGGGNQVATHELQTATQSSKYRCFKSVWLVWQSSKQNGKSTSYPFLKNLCVQKLASFPFPYIFFLLRFLRTFQFSFVLFGETAVVSRVFLWNFSRKVGTRLAETDPLAHARRLTVVYELTGCVLCVTCNLIYCGTANMITMFLTYS